MMVPAVCDSCGAFFPSGYDLHGTEIKLAGNRAGPCPRCGGMGHIPDGTYNFIGDTIELLSGPARSRSELQRLTEILQSARARKASIEEVQGEIRSNLPELSSLADILPTTRSELYAFISIILSILTLILSQLDRGTSQKIEVNQVINQITSVAPPPRNLQVPGHATVPKVGRNELCSCGSGKKFKKCHGHSR
jgi:hypothetical protein